MGKYLGKWLKVLPNDQCCPEKVLICTDDDNYDSLCLWDEDKHRPWWISENFVEIKEGPTTFYMMSV